MSDPVPPIVPPTVVGLGGVTKVTSITEENATAASQSSQKETHNQAEETRRTGSQLSTHLIWETTQAIIAISITWSILYVCITLATGKDMEGSRQSLLLLNGAFVMVVGLYLQRTNHTKTSSAGEGTTQR